MKQKQVGYVISISDYLLTLNGLPEAKINDLIIDQDGNRAWVSGLLENSVQALLIDESSVKVGSQFQATDLQLSTIVSNELLGKVISPLGEPLSGGKGISSSSPKAPIENQAPGISMRRFISDPLISGLTIIDSMIPLGKGQRELIIGDGHSGKGSFLTDLIVNLAKQKIVCVYASIGQPVTETRMLIDVLSTNKVIDSVVVVSTTSSDPAPLIFINPYAAMTIAEYFQKQGKDVLVIFDDLGVHAKIYREINLLSRRNPGRDSYPGDIFYQHARLLERAGCFDVQAGGGSITALPVVELNLNDFTEYIPTNLMAMTDGHLIFKSSLHTQGQDPAIDIALSVSRVGKQTQNRNLNKLANSIQRLLIDSEKLDTISRFSSELPSETLRILHQKKLILSALKHEHLSFIPIFGQILILAVILSKYSSKITVRYIEQLKKNLSTSPTMFKGLSVLETMEYSKLISYVESMIFKKLKSDG